jgi:peroxiredoxin
MSQLGELEREYDRLREAGLTIFALSTETPAEIAPLQKRLAGRVVFLSQPDGALLDALGRRHPKGVVWYDRWFLRARQTDIALPATLVVGVDGRVRFFHRSRKIDDRPSISAVVGAILTPS